MDLNGSVVLVTGANGGLGREFVRQLLDAAQPRCTRLRVARTSGPIGALCRSAST
jgi:NAD(P)-dependent dehydrogenase (short-subunit alcohol dehydrogenase family)